jgi:peptide deformylase
MRILRYPSDGAALRRKAREVSGNEFGSDALIEFGARLGGIMLDSGGMGLAATQVDETPGGEPWAMFALSTGHGSYGIVCNPEIVLSGDECLGAEGCLSFASVHEVLKAPEFVLLRGYNPRGVLFEMGLTGEHARCAFHECEHLRGRLLIDRMSPLKKKLFLKKVSAAWSRRPAQPTEYLPQGA